MFQHRRSNHFSMYSILCLILWKEEKKVWLLASKSTSWMLYSDAPLPSISWIWCSIVTISGINVRLIIFLIHVRARIFVYLAPLLLHKRKLVFEHSNWLILFCNQRYWRVILIIIFRKKFTVRSPFLFIILLWIRFVLLISSFLIVKIWHVRELSLKLNRNNSFRFFSIFLRVT